MKFLKSQGFQARPVSLISVDDNAGFAIDLGVVGGNHALLEASAEDDVVGGGLVGGDGERQGLVELFFV